VVANKIVADKVIANKTLTDKVVKETTKEVVKDVKEVAKNLGKGAGNTVIAFSPLIFLAWEYYCSGSFIHSCITCCRDFMWPAAVVVASSLNASPYQMLATNVGGIAWTVYNCFFAEHEDPEAVA